VQTVGVETVGNYTIPPSRPTDNSTAILEELRAIRAEHAATNRVLVRLGEMLDEYFGAQLNAAFKFGKPLDRWSRRPRG
jgi:hypothetical protein